VAVPVSAWIILLLIALLPVASLLLVLSRLWCLYARRTRLLSGAPRLVERRAVWASAAACLGLSAACAGYALFVEPQWIEVTRIEVAVPRALLGRERLRIVHLSDLHLEGFGARERSVIEAVREAAPHLIILTGDYMNEGGAQNDLVNFLKSIEAPHGVFGVGGNWDGKWPVAELFASAGATYLRDDWRLVGGDVLLVGQDYHATKSLAELLEGASDGPYRVFLHHSPDAVDELARGRVDLFLCGHTHGGQVRLPFYGALLTMTRHGRRYEQGRYGVAPPASAHPDGTTMYVNRGVGMSGFGPRVRFLARPEVAIIDLVAAR